MNISREETPCNHSRQLIQRDRTDITAVTDSESTELIQSGLLKRHNVAVETLQLVDQLQ